MLLRIYFDNGWWAEWLFGCDIEKVAIDFGTALWLEQWL